MGDVMRSDNYIIYFNEYKRLKNLNWQQIMTEFGDYWLYVDMLCDLDKFIKNAWRNYEPVLATMECARN